MRKMMLLAVVAAMAALMLSASPALADDLDFDGFDDEFGFFVPVGSFDDACSPGLPDGVFIPGCVFSDPIEADLDFEDEDFCDFFECNFEDDFCDFFDCDFDEFCDDFDRDFFCDDEDFCDFFDCDNDFARGFDQDNEQEVESGDAEQSFEITGGGDNSNQIVGVQGVNNTGNAVSNTSVIQTGFGFDGNNDDFEDFCDFFDCEDDFDEEDFCDFFDCDNGFDNGFGGGEVEIEDVGNFTISPSLTVEGSQQVNQAAVAVGRGWK